jgi:uncharacterized membrane protein YdjX (TVP38/TMEM64 family)
MGKISKKNYLPLIALAGLFGGFYLIGTMFSETVIKDIVKNSGGYGIMLFIFLTWLTYILAPLGGTPFLFAGFYLYGQRVVLFTFAAAVIASVTNFWVARIWGREIVEKIAGKENMEKVDKLVQNFGLVSLFVFRVCLGQFHDVLSYMFGLTKIEFWRYLVVSTMGMIPGSMLMFYFSTKMTNPLVFLGMTVLVAYVFFIMYLMWNRFFLKK